MMCVKKNMGDLNMVVVVYISDVIWVFYFLNSVFVCNYLRNMLLIFWYNEGCMKRMCCFCYYFFIINIICMCYVFDSVIYNGVVDYIFELL